MLLAFAFLDEKLAIPMIPFEQYFRVSLTMCE